MQNLSRKIFKQAARCLRDVNGSGTRKIWERAMVKVLKDKGFTHEQRLEFSNTIIERKSRLDEIAKKFSESTDWFDTPSGLKVRTKVWTWREVKIYLHDDLYIVCGKTFASLPLAIEYGHDTYEPPRPDSPLVQACFSGGATN